MLSKVLMAYDIYAVNRFTYIQLFCGFNLLNELRQIHDLNDIAKRKGKCYTHEIIICIYVSQLPYMLYF